MAFSVSYAEMHGYPRSEWDQGEFDAERRVLVAWSDRVTFLNELDVYPNFLYPYADGPAGATAKKAKIFPFGASTAASGSSLASYQYALIQIFHTTRGPQWDTTLGVHIQERITPAAQYYMASRRKLRWYNDNAELSPNDEPRLDDTLYEYTVKYSRLLSVPAWVLTRPGVCNSNSVTCQTIPITFVPYTLRYTGATISVSWSLGLTKRYDVSASFLFKSSGWNTFWRPDGGTAGTGGWEKLKTQAGNEYIQHQPVVINVAP